ncbi:F10K1.23 [Zea mays]|uniref:F10K1.23 n=1 Tax=Zea mays TaxID=4577 RepID=A0A1D6LQ45_MAIZE|nr:F10K1.23 [Zea mays]
MAKWASAARATTTTDRLDALNRIPNLPSPSTMQQLCPPRPNQRSCLAMRYEALLLRDAKYCNDLHLQVSRQEWLTFAMDCLDNGFYTIASKVWDVTRSQVFVEMREHERRVWSVDFSIMDPTKLVSGSDDGSVKLRDMNQAILFLHLLLGVLALLKQGQMCVLCNFNLILLAPLPSALQTTKFTAMIYVTYELLIVH